MPRAPKPRYTYWVFVYSYADHQIKEGVEAGRLSIISPDQISATKSYSGNDERQAGIAFYRACKAAMNDRLVYLVLLLRDNDEIARVKPERKPER